MKRLTIKLTTTDDNFKTYIKTILSELAAHDENQNYIILEEKMEEKVEE